MSYVLNIILNVSLFACTPVTHVLKITRRGEGGGGGGAHTWRWMTQNPRRNRELMAGSLALVNAFLPNNSRQPRREEGKEGGEQNLILPSSPLQPSFFFFFFFLARLSRPSMLPSSSPFLFFFDEIALYLRECMLVGKIQVGLEQRRGE